MNQYYDEVPGEYPDGRSNVKAGEVSGNAWRAYPDGESYVFEYVSGELAGREKSIFITKEEFAQLKEGVLDMNKILIIHGAW